MDWAWLIVLAPTGCLVVIVLSIYHQTNPYKQARRAHRKARERVNAVLWSAKLMMDAATGARHRGERPMDDGLGSWRDW